MYLKYLNYTLFLTALTSIRHFILNKIMLQEVLCKIVIFVIMINRKINVSVDKFVRLIVLREII